MKEEMTRTMAFRELNWLHVKLQQITTRKQVLHRTTEELLSKTSVAGRSGAKTTTKLPESVDRCILR